VTFLYDDIVHALQNTLDSCINSAMHRSTRLEHRFTEFSEITQCNGHYAVQNHSLSPILVLIESPYTISYQWLILTYILSYTVSKLWMIIGQIFASESGAPNFNALAGDDRWSPANIVINDISLKTRFFGLHFRCRKYWSIFNHFYVIRRRSYW